MKRIIKNIIILLTLTSCSLINTAESEISLSLSTGSRALSAEDIEELTLTVSAADMDEISLTTTSSFVSLDVPFGSERKFSVSLKLKSGIVYIGQVTKDISSSSSNIIIDMNNTSFTSVLIGSDIYFTWPAFSVDGSSNDEISYKIVWSTDDKLLDTVLEANNSPESVSFGILLDWDDVLTAEYDNSKIFYELTADSDGSPLLYELTIDARGAPLGNLYSVLLIKDKDGNIQSSNITSVYIEVVPV